jgi:cysteine synthase A
MTEAARQLSLRPDHFWADQFNNLDVLSGYQGLGDELWSQTGGRIDAFVQAVGTGGSLRGTAEALRRHDRNIHIVAVEPEESPVLSGGRARGQPYRRDRNGLCRATLGAGHRG